ncbi:MAG: putative metal-binding motif-containing protein [Myxococcota bacterium]
MVWVALLASVAGAAAPTSTGDTGGASTTDPGLDVDADGDGFTPRDGDCDDTSSAARPGLAEVCEDRIDNDCDGLPDGGCDDAVRLASLRGGGGCTGGSGIAGTAGIVPMVLFGWRRRR